MFFHWYYKLSILILLFFLSAFFSGSEVALFSLDRKKIKKVLSSNPIIYRYLHTLLEHPKRLLVTVLIGNTIVNVGASIIAVSIALDIATLTSFPRNIILTIEIILLTILIILFGELVPKVWASKRPLMLAKIVAVPLYWISVILYPVAEIFTEFIKLSISRLKFNKANSVILHDEISELANIGQERGTIEEEEQGLIKSIVSLKSVTVQEVMTPRVDIISVDVDTNFNELLEIITSSGHSRIPLYENDLDNIVGVIYAKDILPYLKNEELRRQITIRQIARKVLFIPQAKMINDMMYEFQEKKMHIAIVVDEYGGTAGLITMEDILEEIVGEIRDEYDKEESSFTKVNESQYNVLGKIPVNELNELLDEDFSSEDEDYETLGGLVLNQAGHIPKDGYSFILKNHKFTVKEVSNKRIKKVHIEKLPPEFEK
ncbi:MAG: hemolysin family protein [Ignavibacteriaceae bacterium]